MHPAATLVWLSLQPPDAQESRALSSWSHAHGVDLAPPIDRRPPPLAVDPGIGDRVETWLDAARDAIAAHDGEQADDALSAAEAMLRAHPELPQGAWLMAEVQRARAARWLRVPPLDAQAAEEAWTRAEALDGGRVAGVGEEASPKHPPRSTLVLDLSPNDTTPWLDGKPALAIQTATAAGLHALVVTSGGAPVWAAWMDLPEGTSTARVSVDGAPACSTSDVAPARLAGPAVLETRRVRCPEWVAAARGSRPGSIRVATCEAGRCGPFFEWQTPAPWTWSPPVQDVAESRKWPAWATWALIGGGAAIAASVTVLASGVLQAAPTETRFVSGGIRSQ